MKYWIHILIIFSLLGCKKYGCIEGDCVNGFGTHRYNNGGTDRGQWVDGKMNGYGRQVQGEGEYEGDIYEGYFKDGLYHGKGTYYFAKYDAKRIGEYINGQAHGVCTMIFGENSSWEGTYSGTWTNGVNKEFDEYVKTDKYGKQYVFSPSSFFDTITYYYHYTNLDGFWRFGGSVNEKVFSNDKLEFHEVMALVDSIQTRQHDLTFSIAMINSFREFDSTIPYKKSTHEFLTVIKEGFDDEMFNWVMNIQHNPDDYRSERVYEIFEPWIERVKKKNVEWMEVHDEFVEKYFDE